MLGQTMTEDSGRTLAMKGHLTETLWDKMPQWKTWAKGVTPSKGINPITPGNLSFYLEGIPSSPFQPIKLCPFSFPLFVNESNLLSKWQTFKNLWLLFCPTVSTFQLYPPFYFPHLFFFFLILISMKPESVAIATEWEFLSTSEVALIISPSYGYKYRLLE